jgi:hypothetical protein
VRTTARTQTAYCTGAAIRCFRTRKISVLMLPLVMKFFGLVVRIGNSQRPLSARGSACRNRSTSRCSPIVTRAHVS